MQACKMIFSAALATACMIATANAAVVEGYLTRVQVVGHEPLSGSITLEGKEYRFGTGYGCTIMSHTVLDGLIEAVQAGRRVGMNPRSGKSGSGNYCVGTVEFYAP